MGRHNSDSKKINSDQTKRSPEYMATATGAMKKEEARLKRIVKELEKSEENFRAFFEAMPAGTVQLSLETEKFLSVNDWFCKITGYSREELLTMTAAEITHPDDRAHHRQFFEEVKRGRSPEHRVEKRFTRKDGSHVWVQLTVTLIRDAAGKPLRAAAIIQDITDRKRAEEAFAKSQAEFKAIFNSLSDAAIFVDTDRRIQLANPAFTSQFGYTFEEVRGKTTEFLYADPADYKKLGRKRSAASVKAPQQTLTIQYQRKDGTRFWSETSGVKVRNADGNIVGFAGISRDITERKRAEEALRASTERLQNAISIETVGVLFFNLDGRMTAANAAFERMSGYSSEELRSITHWHTLTPPEFGDVTVRAAGELATRGETAPYEKQMIRKDGSRWWGLFAPTRLAGTGRNSECVEFIIDITERRRAEDQLTRAKELSDALNRINEVIHSTLEIDMIMKRVVEEAAAALRVDASSIGLFEDGYFVNKHIYKMPEEFLRLRIPSGEIKGVCYAASIKDVVAFNDAYNDERVHRGLVKKYRVRSLLIAPFVIKGTVPGAMNFYCFSPYVFSDADVDFTRKLSAALSLALENARLFHDQKKMEEDMRHMAHHDPLTGLPNRRLFLDIINVERRQADRNRKKMAVLFLDLDRFKEINDTLGHDTGNRLLKEVSSRLMSLLRKSDTIARIGGDEFNIILADIARPEDTADVARNIVASFRKPYSVDGHELNVTTSVGISIYPDDNDDIDTLLRYADIAMYRAKELGRNRYQFYDSSINIKSLERMRLEGMLKQSLDLGEMEIYYQPLVDIRTRRVVCAEALARWRLRDRGLLLPKDFIPAAEETGFINELGEWSLRAVCRQIRTWLDAGNPFVRVTVNLSARQFQDPELVAKVSSVLKETGISPRWLGLEITETVAMSDVERSAARMKELQSMAIQVSIDDFGTGYSSLNYLKRLPIERLKVDRSFVQDIAIDPDDRTIVQAVTAMAHSMKMKVVAEGVETEEQLEFVTKTGCDEMQGFFFSEPLTADEFEELLKAA